MIFDSRHLRAFALLPLMFSACGEDETTPNPSAPVAPSQLNAVVGANGVKLTWKDNSSDEDGFLIMKQVDSGAYAELPLVAADATEFQDSDVTAGKMYMYMVHAKRGAELSGASNEAMAMP